MNKITFLIAFLAFAVSVSAANPAISAKEFMDLMKSNKELIIIDGSKAADYTVQHVKGAVNIWHADLFVSGIPEGMLKSPEDLAKYFGSKGIKEKSQVVVYDDGSNKYTSRIYYILKYLGNNNVSILTKNMTEWEKVRIPINSNPVKLPAVAFNAVVDKSMMIDIALAKEKMKTNSITLIDCRTNDEYLGQDKEKKSQGHIPGAIDISHKDLLNADGSFKSKTELEAMAMKLGIPADKELVFYCASGVRAAVGYIAFKEILGFADVKVLEGGINHWVLDKDNIVERN